MGDIYGKHTWKNSICIEGSLYMEIGLLRWNVLCYLAFMSPLSITFWFLLGNYASLHSQSSCSIGPITLPLPLWMASAPGLTYDVINITFSQSQLQIPGWTRDSNSTSETKFHHSCETVKKVESLLSSAVAKRSCISPIWTWVESAGKCDQDRQKQNNQQREQTLELRAFSKLLHPAGTCTLSV